MKEYLEDYEIGETFVTPGRTITEADIHDFASLTGDWHPLHTDITFAEKSRFQGRIAHGFLVLSVGSALILRLGQYVGLPKSFIALYGIDNVRFTEAVRINDMIHLESKVTDIYKKNDDMGVVTFTGNIINQKGELCCSYESKIACGRKTGKGKA